MMISAFIGFLGTWNEFSESNHDDDQELTKCLFVFRHVFVSIARQQTKIGPEGTQDPPHARAFRQDSLSESFPR
jgi:hypothetical protein